MKRIIIFILSFYFGLGSFFSYIVAPILFNTLGKSTAGNVVEKIFPLYFGIGLGAVFISTLMSVTSKMSAFLNLLLTVNLIVLVALNFNVLPGLQSLPDPSSSEFLKMHVVSTIMSTVSLFFTFGAIVYLIVKNGSP